MAYNPKIRKVGERKDRYFYYGGGTILGGIPPTGALGDPGANGIVVRTALDTTVARSLVQPVAGITISNADGVGGNPTLALANDLAALEGLGNGIPARTGADTWSARTLTGTANRITISNGDGVAGTPTFDIGTDVVTLTGTQTLSAKTLTAPRFASAGFIADNNGNELIIFTTTASAVNEVTYANASTGTNPTWTASGGDANVGINFVPKGTGAIQVSGVPIVTTTATQTLSGKTLTTPIIMQINDTNSNELFIFTATASAVNEVTYANAATGNRPTFSATGGDANIGININPKGTGSIQITAQNAAGVGLIVDSAASPTADIFQARQNTSSTAQFAVKPDGMFTYPGIFTLAADFSKTDTTFATITGFSLALRAGRTYILDAYLRCDLNTTGGGKFQYTFSGTFTRDAMEIQSINTVTNAIIGEGGVQVNGTFNEGITAPANNLIMIRINGTLVVNAAGTFNLQFAQNSASGTSSVTALVSYMRIMEQQ